MKCTNLIRLKTVGKKNPKTVIAESVSQTHVNDGLKLHRPLSEYDVCGGNIKSSVDIEEGSTCHCCSYPELTITFECERCKANHFVNIDDVKSLLDELVDKHFDDIK